MHVLLVDICISFRHEFSLKSESEWLIAKVLS